MTNRHFTQLLKEPEKKKNNTLFTIKERFLIEYALKQHISSNQILINRYLGTGEADNELLEMVSNDNDTMKTVIRKLADMDKHERDFLYGNL